LQVPTRKDAVKLFVNAIFGIISGTAFADPCPGRLMEGRVQTRLPDQRVWEMRAIVGGKILLMGPDSAITGHAKVACGSGHLIADFSSMSDHHKYHCDGGYSGSDFLAVCKLDKEFRDIGGRFSK
jgi:hypothetical protein